MRTNFLYCLLAVVLISLWAAHRPAPSGLRLQLTLSKHRGGHDFTLSLQDGAVHSSLKNVPGPTRTLTAGQIDQLGQELHKVGAWELGDADSQDSEANVLYTYLEVQQDDQPPHSSRWRGLAPNSPQQRCAQVLLNAPFGADISAALKTL